MIRRLLSRLERFLFGPLPTIEEIGRDRAEADAKARREPGMEAIEIHAREVQCGDLFRGAVVTDTWTETDRISGDDYTRIVTEDEQFEFTAGSLIEVRR